MCKRFLLTAINLMRLARPAPDHTLQPSVGPPLASLAETLLDTLQGTMSIDMKMGIASGNIGEIALVGHRLVFSRELYQRQTPAASQSQSLDHSEVEV